MGFKDNQPSAIFQAIPMQKTAKDHLKLRLVPFWKVDFRDKLLHIDRDLPLLCRRKDVLGGDYVGHAQKQKQSDRKNSQKIHDA